MNPLKLGPALAPRHNGSGFTIAAVGPGPLLQLMLPIPYTRQLIHHPCSMMPDWKKWLTLLVSQSRGRFYLPAIQLIRLQYSVLLAAAPPLPSHSRDWTILVPGAGGHPSVAIVQCDWTTVCCFGVYRIASATPGLLIRWEIKRLLTCKTTPGCRPGLWWEYRAASPMEQWNLLGYRTTRSLS